jgi:hypothetical protein
MANQPSNRFDLEDVDDWPSVTASGIDAFKINYIPPRHDRCRPPDTTTLARHKCHGITSPRAHRQIHRQPPIFQSIFLFALWKGLTAKGLRTYFRLRRALVQTQLGSLVREHPTRPIPSYVRSVRSEGSHFWHERAFRSHTQDVHPMTTVER